MAGRPTAGSFQVSQAILTGSQGGKPTGWTDSGACYQLGMWTLETYHWESRFFVLGREVCWPKWIGKETNVHSI